MEVCAALHCFHTKKYWKTWQQKRKLNYSLNQSYKLINFFVLWYCEWLRISVSIFLWVMAFMRSIYLKSHVPQTWKNGYYCCCCFFGTVMCFASRHYEIFQQHRLQESVHSPYSMLSVCSFDWEHNYSHWMSLLLIVSFRFVCVGEMLVFQCVHLRESIYS